MSTKVKLLNFDMQFYGAFDLLCLPWNFILVCFPWNVIHYCVLNLKLHLYLYIGINLTIVVLSNWQLNPAQPEVDAETLSIPCQSNQSWNKIFQVQKIIKVESRWLNHYRFHKVKEDRKLKKIRFDTWNFNVSSSMKTEMASCSSSTKCLLICYNYVLQKSVCLKI